MNVLKQALTVTATGLAEFCDIDVQHFTSMAFRVKNTGSFAFDAFQISVKFHESDAAWTVVANQATDFSSPSGYPVKHAVGAPVTLAAGAEARVVLDISMAHRLRIEASANGTNSTAELSGVIK